MPKSINDEELYDVPDFDPTDISEDDFDFLKSMNIDPELIEDETLRKQYVKYLEDTS